MFPVLFLQRLQKHSPIRLFALSLVAIAAAILTGSALKQQEQPQRLMAQTKPIHPQALSIDPTLDSETNSFAMQTRAIDNAHECFPVYMKDIQSVGILYFYCSDSALEMDGEGQEITDNFSVDPRIARRYNFWRRIYSLWGSNQYVMHSSRWPEVVLEAIDGTALPATLGPVAKERKIKKVATQRRTKYKKLLLSMHKNRHHPEKFSPSMKRIERSMAHITDKSKYYVAAVTLRMQKGQRDYIATGLERAPLYLPHIQKNFAEIGVPAELALIAFVESSFNLKARSKVGASGVYQIMPATGKQYLKLYGGIDERNDPIKASRAAAKLFKLNYKILQHWPLAITAYNHGVGGVRNAVRKTGTSDIVELIDYYNGRAFKFASKNFYTSFLGVLATIKDAKRVFPQVVHPQPMNFRTVKLRRPTSIKSLRKSHSVSLTEIQSYNPDIARWMIRRQGTLPRGYVIKLPKAQNDTEADVKPVKLIPNS